MKAFILLFVILVIQRAFGQKTEEKITTANKAASTFQNCDCQCDSDTWTDGNTIKGNCQSTDRNGAAFCYISGRALRACRDIQTSSFLPNNNGRFKQYSYEACVTPPRNQCGQFGTFGNNQFGNNQFGNNQFVSNQNLGDGDIATIQQGAGLFGNNQFGNNQFGNNQFGNNQFRNTNNQNLGDGDIATIQQSTGVQQGAGVNQGFGQGIIGSGILTGGAVRVKAGNSGSKGTSSDASSDASSSGAINFGDA